MSGAPPPSLSGKPKRIYLCAYFPEWSIDVTRRKLEASQRAIEPSAILLTVQQGNNTLVGRACHNAMRAGIRPTMTLQLARALLPAEQVYCETFDPVRDTTALHTLATWCLRFSPHVGLDTELHNARLRNECSTISPLYYGIVIDLSGTQRIYGDFQDFAYRLCTLFSGKARIAIAPTIGGAWALSRFGTPSPYLAPSLPALTEAVQNLPLDALRIALQSRKALHEVGIRTIGELLEIPRHLLVDRFGKHVLFRLSQLLGSIEERVYTISARPHYSKRSLFEPPLTHKRSITLAIKNLFAALITSLKQTRTLATLYTITLRDTTGATTRKTLPLASATNDIQHLTTIIQPIIDAMTFCGELREIEIEASQTARATSSQANFAAQAESSEEDRQLARQELLNAFSIRIGKDRISYARLTNSCIPERSFTYQSALDDSLRAGDLCALNESAALYGPLERPPVLFAEPEPITTLAMLPDKPPSRITWRKTTLAIISGSGPERIAPEWWRGDLQRSNFSERDYFAVQDESGRWLWIFRDNSTQDWFAHGVWT